MSAWDYYSSYALLGQVTLFHICGDNIDHTMKQQYMRVGKTRPDEIHYFHSYAVSDRIDFSGLSERVVPTLAQDPEQVALSLLPTPEDDEAIRNNMCTLISRIIYEKMDFARLTFDGVVNWHITHDFYKEMSRKSVVVSVFVVYHTPTKYPYPQKHSLWHLPPITHTHTHTHTHTV